MPHLIPAQPMANAASRKPTIIFVHTQVSGQFQFFGKWLAEQGWTVYAVCEGLAAPRVVDGIRVRCYQPAKVHYDKSDFRHILDYAASNAFGTFQLFERLRREEGVHPDIVVAHIGWGLGLGVKDIWPETFYIAYNEWYYTSRDWSRGGSPEKVTLWQHMLSNRISNMTIIPELHAADANWCPTRFQASRFPPALRAMLQIVPDGVDCEACAPDPNAKVRFDWLDLSGETRILTYATRGLEPTRGFPQFMAGLAELQRRRSDFHTVIMARDRTFYDAALPPDDSWRLRMMDQHDLDWRRIHYSSTRPRPEYLQLLKASSVHVYFTQPFVTSWSLFDAMACGCYVVGSNTASVQELIEDFENGALVDMNEPEEIADAIEWAFDHPEEARAIGLRARQTILDHHDARQVFPEKEALLRSYIASRADGGRTFR